MQVTGTVRKTDGKTAYIVIRRESACGENCANCGGCKNKTNEITATNEIEARPGDTVTVEMEDGRVLKAAFMVYMVPLIIFFTAYFVSDMIFKLNMLSITFGIVLSVLFYVFLHFYDKKQKEKYIHKIIEINDLKGND